MKNNYKDETAYKTIGEVAKKLGLINKKTGHLQTHTIRYWETQFKQIKPRIKAGRRRYYSIQDFKIIKYIKYLLKEKGLTVVGVKRILNNKEGHSLDDAINLGVYNPGLETTKILNRLKLKSVLLVTHDYHLLRLVSVFKKLGVEVYSYAENESYSKESIPWWRYFEWSNFNRIQTVAHEYFGLLRYKFSGWI